MNSSTAREIRLDIVVRNEIKKLILNELPNLLPQLQNFLSKKIFFANGDKAKIFKITFTGKEPKPLNDEGFAKLQNCYLSANRSYLILKIIICLNGDKYTRYENKTIELGLLESNQTLLSLSSIEEINQIFALCEILDFDIEVAKIKAYKAMQDQADKLKSTIRVRSEAYKYI